MNSQDAVCGSHSPALKEPGFYLRIVYLQGWQEFQVSSTTVKLSCESVKPERWLQSPRSIQSS